MGRPRRRDRSVSENRRCGRDNRSASTTARTRDEKSSASGSDMSTCTVTLRESQGHIVANVERRSDSTPERLTVMHLMLDEALSLQMAEIGVDGRLEEIERRRIDDGGCKPGQDPMHDRLRAERSGHELERRSKDAIGSFGVELHELSEFAGLQNRAVSSHRNPVRDAARSLQGVQVVGQGEEIGNTVFVEDVLRQDDVGAEKDV